MNDTLIAILNFFRIRSGHIDIFFLFVGAIYTDKKFQNVANPMLGGSENFSKDEFYARRYKAT